MINKNISTINGIVINVSPYKETSAICSLITSNGLESVYISNAFKVKNSLKPLLIPFNYLSIEYSLANDKLLIAKSCEIITDYSFLITSYKNNLFLQCIIQLITSLFKYNEHFNIESLLLILDGVKGNKDLLSELLLFVGSIYSDLGIKQNTNNCVICSKTKNIVSYSLNDGGFICEDCISKISNINIKNKNELYIFKYAFSVINASNINKTIPKDDGCKVLNELCKHLESYFGISRLTSIDIFIEYLHEKS